jgi:hypothetical protein
MNGARYVENLIKGNENSTEKKKGIKKTKRKGYEQ